LGIDECLSQSAGISLKTEMFTSFPSFK